MIIPNFSSSSQPKQTEIRTMKPSCGCFLPPKRRKPALRAAERVCEIFLKDYQTDPLPTTQCVRFEQFFDTRPTVAFQSPYSHPVEKFQTARGVVLRRVFEDAAADVGFRIGAVRSWRQVYHTRHASSITHRGRFEDFRLSNVLSASRETSFRLFRSESPLRQEQHRFAFRIPV